MPGVTISDVSPSVTRVAVDASSSVSLISNATSVNIPARVSAIEYDPNRTARLALLVYADGEKRYIIAPVGLKVDDSLLSGPTAEIRPGNSLPIANIPGWYDGSQYRAERGQRRPDGYDQPELLHNCWQKKAIMPRSVCHLVKFA